MTKFAKKLLCVLLLVSSSLTTIYSQNNINIDTNRFKFKIRELPTKPLNPLFFYYNISIQIPTTVSTYISDTEIGDNIMIEGQRFTEDSSKADLLVTMKMDPISIKSTEVKERVEEKKNKSGEITERIFYYWLEVIYSYNALGMTQQGDEKQSYSLSQSGTKTYRSSEYSNGRSASEYWKNNKDILIEKFTREGALDSAKKFTSILSSQKGFPLVNYFAYIKTMNEKKHPENDALREKSDELTQKLEMINGTNPLDINDFSDIIVYFDDIPKRYTDPKSKADKKLRYIAYYNLARIYMYLEQPEKSKTYADLLSENEHDKKDGEKLNKESDKMIQRFASSDIKTTQFDPDDYFKDSEVAN